MQSPTLGAIFLALAQLFGPVAGKSHCRTVYSLSPVTTSVGTYTYPVTEYGKTDIVTYIPEPRTSYSYGHTKTVTNSDYASLSYYAYFVTTGPTTTTIATTAGFTPMASAPNATLYERYLLCAVTTTLSGQTTTVVTQLQTHTPTVTVTYPKSTTTSTVYLEQPYTTSTVHVSVVTEYAACQSDNVLSHFHGEDIIFVQGSASASGPQFISCENGNVASYCPTIRAAQQSPRDCCHAMWDTFPTGDASGFSSFMYGGGEGCTWFTGDSLGAWDFWTGPTYDSNNGVIKAWFGNGPGGHAYYRGYRKTKPSLVPIGFMPGPDS